MPDLLDTPTTFVPTVRPVRHLVAAIVGIGLVSIGVWWTGAVGPRVTAVVRAVDADPVTGRGTLHVEVRNRGPLPVEVRGVGVDSTGGPTVEVGSVVVDGQILGAEPVRLAGGGVARIDVPYATDCDRPTGYGADPVLSVRVRAPVGTTQARRIEAAGVEQDGPVDPGPLLCPFETASR